MSFSTQLNIEIHLLLITEILNSLTKKPCLKVQQNHNIHFISSYNQRSTFTVQNINDRNKLTMRIILFLLFTAAAALGWGQSIWTNPITGSNPNTSNPYTIGQTVDPNISVSGIGRGSGIAGSNANDRYNANSWNTATIDLTAYFEFTLTPNATFCLNFTNFIYTGQISGTGATSFAFRSSLDGFTTNIGTPNSTGTTIDLTSASYQNLTSAVTFRLFGWGASAAAGTFSINSFIFNGSTSCGSSNTITTTSVATSPFVVTCNTAATGSVDFTSTGTFNSGNIYTAELSNAAGSFAAPVSIGTLGSTANTGTISVSIPVGTSTGNGYRIRVVSNTPLTTGTDNGSNISITLNPCTITTGFVSGGPFSVDCSFGDAGSVAFNSSGTFTVGNTFTVQLSSAAGSFASPTAIGTLTGASAEGLNPGGSINFTIPSTTTTGAGYLIRIVSSNPSIIGTSSGANTITLSGGPCTLTPPYMTSLIYDGCNSACSGGTTEGRSEIIFGNTGGYSVEVNPTNVNFIYNTNGNQPLTNGLVNNSASTTNLNTEAGCPGLFLDGFGQTLSPNTSFLVVSQNVCISSLIWSDLCGSGPIYVLYASASGATWNDGGNFGNSSGTRNLQTIITSSDGSVHDISYSYTSVNGGDGSYATWTSNGGTSATSGIFSNCRLSPVALPSGISLFKAVSDRTNALLYWQTNSEQNNDYFTIAHSTSGYDFEVLGQVQGAGNSSTLNNYNFLHSRPAQGINYYKLTSTDFDGAAYTKGIVSLLFNSNGCYFDAQTSEIKFNERSDYRIFSMDGKLLGEVMNESSMLFNQQGIVLIQDLRTGLTERLFVP